MKTIQTKPDCTLGFIEVKPEWFNFKARFDGSWWLYGSNKNIPDNNPFSEVETFEDEHVLTILIEKVRGEFRDISVIGKLSEITEEQARKLVDYDRYGRHGDQFRDYIECDWNTKRPYKWDTAIYSIHSAAQSVGIEEKDFDKCLVIKL